MRIIFFFFMVLITSFLSAQEAQRGKLIYENNFASEKNLADWIMEGAGKIEFVNNTMEMYSPNEEGHHVFWCPNDFPKDFIAEWDAKNIETDAGLCIIFFAVKGLKGQSIFDSSMPKRTTGVFTDYTKGAMNCYHISYYANAKDDAHRETANLRKNKGFNLMLTVEKGISMESTSWNHIKLVKLNNQITMYADDRKIIDWTDDGVKYGAVLNDGKIGFRQMKWTHFAYKNFKVWNCKASK